MRKLKCSTRALIWACGDYMRSLKGHFNLTAYSLRQRCDLFHLGLSVWCQNRPVKELIAVPAVSVGEEPALSDKDIHRLLSAYRASKPESYYDEQSVWGFYFKSKLIKLHKIFMRGSIPEARQELANPGSNKLFYGFDNTFDEITKKMQQKPSHQLGMAKLCLGELITLAEAFGVLPCDRPESGHWRNNRFLADDVIKRLEIDLGVKIEFPNPYPLEYGLATQCGIASYRSIHALHQTLFARKLLHEQRSARLLEIGAGLGRGAFYASKLGVAQYDIVDLPLTMLSQGYFLMSTLGADKVRLGGEPYLTTPGCVNLLLPPEFLNDEQRYDLAINVDSFPEIDQRIAQQYWNKIESCSNRFLSINHEFNELTVKELYKGSPRVQSVTRHPSWMRRGYVEELIEF